MQQNPFIISGYISPEYFCDREEETARMFNAIKNSRHITLFSPRRMGKTGLIRHLFYYAGRNKEFVFSQKINTSLMMSFLLSCNS